MPLYERTTGERVYLVPDSQVPSNAVNLEMRRMEDSPEWRRISDHYEKDLVVQQEPAPDAETEVVEEEPKEEQPEPKSKKK
jgi:hypothetical protein